MDVAAAAAAELQHRNRLCTIHREDCISRVAPVAAIQKRGVMTADSWCVVAEVVVVRGAVTCTVTRAVTRTERHTVDFAVGIVVWLLAEATLDDEGVVAAVAVVVWSADNAEGCDIIDIGVGVIGVVVFATVAPAATTAAGCRPADEPSLENTNTVNVGCVIVVDA